MKGDYDQSVVMWPEKTAVNRRCLWPQPKSFNPKPKATAFKPKAPASGGRGAFPQNAVAFGLGLNDNLPTLTICARKQQIDD